MAKSTDLVTRKLGMNKGKRRLWIEGAVLNTHGFTHGKRFNVETSANMLVITTSLDGKRKIAGKPGREIIDMSAKTITDAFADTVKIVSIECSKNRLVIRGVK